MRIGLKEELERIRDFYSATAEEKQIGIHVDCPDECIVEADHVFLQRALGNLVENSLAHTASPGEIRLAAIPQDGRVRIEVADTGTGIAPEHLPHVFERFYRGESGRSGTVVRIGLGLAIVKRVAEMHGGAVEITSQVGKGTSVSLKFPRIVKPPA